MYTGAVGSYTKKNTQVATTFGATFGNTGR